MMRCAMVDRKKGKTQAGKHDQARPSTGCTANLIELCYVDNEGILGLGFSVARPASVFL